MVLANPKREKFAVLCAKGLTTIDAYERAGYKRNSGNAATLRNTPDVMKRIEELRMAFDSTMEEDLADFISEKKISPASIMRDIYSLIEDAKEAKKYELVLRAYKDIGTQLFGMFVENKNTLFEKTNAPPPPVATLNVEGLNQALEGLAYVSKSLSEADKKPRQLEQARTIVPENIIELLQPERPD